MSAAERVEPMTDRLAGPVCHEVGHLVAAWILRGDAGVLGAIEVGGDGWQQGQADVGHEARPSPEAWEQARHDASIGVPIAPEVRDYVETTVIIRQTGRVAEAEALRRGLYAPIPPEVRLREYATVEATAGPRPPDDGELVEQLLRAVTAGPEEADEWRRLLLERTYRLVESHPLFWRLAIPLAPVLADRRRLEREESLALIHQVLSPPFVIPPGVSGYSE